MSKVYKDMFGKVPDIKAIHAGLECGLIGGVYPDLDMISFGPTIRFPHSPDEKVEIASVDKFWKFLVETLKHVPVKNTAGKRQIKGAMMKIDIMYYRYRRHLCRKR